MDTALKINAIKNHLNIKKDIDLASYLGVKQSTLATWKLRNTMDIDVIISKCDFINPSWLLTGEGPMLKESNQLNTMDANKEADLLRSEIEILKKSNEEKERTIQRLFEQFEKLSEQNQVLVSIVTNTSVPKKKEAI